MTDKQTPGEIIARLAEMTDDEFSQFMAWHFAELCKRPFADTSREEEKS